jgi:hypothetical protein
MVEKYPINVWINEERYEKLQQTGLANMTEDVLAGMKVLKLQCTEGQKDEILKLYPMAKFDTATTRSIELLPAEVKDKMFNLVVKNKSLDVVEEFLKEIRRGTNRI